MACFMVEQPPSLNLKFLPSHQKLEHGYHSWSSSLALQQPNDTNGLSVKNRRKRPSPISIPPPPQPKVEEAISQPSLPCNNNTQEKGSCYAVVSNKGQRRQQIEDTFSAIHHSQHAFFGVFDGHRGCNASKYAAANMGNNIVKHIPIANNLEEAVRAGYLATDVEFSKQGENGGTTSVTALINDGSLIVSNVGDSRAVICRDGVAQAVTTDHRPGNHAERQRLENLGGLVDSYRGVWRVQGTLGVSRAIGDCHMKELIIAEPESTRIDIDSHCEFLIMASDGLWDKVGNQEAVDIARNYCSESAAHEGQRGPIAACAKLVELATHRQSMDDVTVMIILLQPFSSSPSPQFY